MTDEENLVLIYTLLTERLKIRTVISGLISLPHREPLPMYRIQAHSGWFQNFHEGQCSLVLFLWVFFSIHPLRPV